ncbi:MAG TPA: hypothetical protein VIL99_13385 [Ignavibacteria bacterium]
MFKTIHKLMFGLLMIALFCSNITEAQTTKTKVVFPQFSISPIVGVQFPTGGLNDTYNPSFHAGVDFCLRVNKETAFYLNGGYFNMPIKSEIPPGPNASYIAITAGPRYFFTSSSIKALLILEAGAGIYIVGTKEWTSAGTPSITIASTSSTAFGCNVGPGVIIPLGTTMDLILKTKVHYIFQKGGDRIFVGAGLGLNFAL